MSGERKPFIAGMQPENRTASWDKQKHTSNEFDYSGRYTYLKHLKKKN